jgi:hypothetical protein
METTPKPSEQKPQKPAPSGIRDNPQPLGTRSRRTYMSSGKVRSHVPNHRSRHSAHLTEQQAIGLIAAAVHARNIERPLNRFITIHLERGDLDPRTHRAQDAVGRYLRLAGQWLADRDVPITFIWVLEHAQGTGLHAHILIHVPPALAKDFGYRARSRWLSLCGIEPQKNVIRSKPVGPRGFGLVTATSKDRQSYLNQLQGVLRYITKAINPDAKSKLLSQSARASRPSAAELLGIESEYCEPIYGRRCSRSQNIGEAARTRYAEERLGPIPATVPGGKTVMAWRGVRA